jgi:type IV secretory pathway TraG/TraD family ATPase VirD4
MNFNSPPPPGRDPDRKHDSRQRDEFEFSTGHQTGIERLLESDEGYIVGRLGDQLLRLKTESHLITTSPTGGGKGTGAIIPNLLAHPGSAFVIDIRGDTVNSTAYIKLLQGQKVVVLDPYNLTKGWYVKDSFNPLHRVAQSVGDVDFDNIVSGVTNALFYKSNEENRTKSDPIWEDSTRDLINELIRYAVLYLPMYKQNLKEIYRILTFSKEELDAFTGELKVLHTEEIDENRRIHLKSLLHILIESKSTTKIADNAIVQAKTFLKWVTFDAFNGMIEESTFSFSDLQADQKMTVYLVLPDKYIGDCAAWVRMIFESAIFSLQSVSDLYGISPKYLSQEQRVLFMFDELSSFGKLSVIHSGINTVRGVGANIWLFVQNLAQLKEVYGDNLARVILANTDLIQAFENDELEELEYFIKIIGEEFYDVQTVTISEGITEGESRTIGRSTTIGNSESFAKSTSKSDTVNESRGVNWNYAKSKSMQRSKSKGGSQNQGTNTSDSKGKGTNSSEGDNFERNFIFNDYLSSNKGKGKNKSSSKNTGQSSGSGTQWNSQTGTTDGTTRSKGGQTSEGTGHTETEGYTHTKQNSNSSTDSDSTTQSTSRTKNISISVKRERMKIDTVRTLREKLNGRNQMLKLRGSNPFFTPRMSFFVKYLDRDQFMFPDLSVMVSLEELNRLKFRPAISDSYKAELQDLLNESQFYIDNMQSGLKRLSTNWERVNSQENINIFQLSVSRVKSVNDKIEKLFKALHDLSHGYNEIGIALMAIMSLLKKNLDEVYWTSEQDQLIERLERVQDRIKLYEKDTKIPELEQLPVNQVKQLDYKGNDIVDELSWITQIYLPVFKEAANLYSEQINRSNQVLSELKENDLWIKERLDQSYHYIYRALEDK